MKVDDAPLALTSAGRVIVNLTHVFGAMSLPELLHQLRPDAEVFIGIVVPADGGRRIVTHLADAAREAADFEAGRWLWCR